MTAAGCRCQRPRTPTPALYFFSSRLASRGSSRAAARTLAREARTGEPGAGFSRWGLFRGASRGPLISEPPGRLQIAAAVRDRSDSSVLPGKATQAARDASCAEDPRRARGSEPRSWPLTSWLRDAMSVRIGGPRGGSRRRRRRQRAVLAENKLRLQGCHITQGQCGKLAGLDRARSLLGARPRDTFAHDDGSPWSRSSALALLRPRSGGRKACKVARRKEATHTASAPFLFCFPFQGEHSDITGVPAAASQRGDLGWERVQSDRQ